MTRLNVKEMRVLAVDPSTRGFGFAVLEGADRLIDWGVKSTRCNKNVQGLAKVKELLRRYEPDVMVLEDCSGEASRRCRRVQRFITAMAKLASRGGIKVRQFSRGHIHRWFSRFSASTKHQIATVIAERFPELVPLLPRYRKAWMSEDHAQSVFDAVGLALTVYKSSGK